MLQQQLLPIVAQHQVAPEIYEMILMAPDLAQTAQPGQFIDVLVPDHPENFLRRPFAIATCDPAQGQISFTYRVKGPGTAAMVNCQPGTALDVLGPLGHGFPIADVTPGMPVLLVGGGTGIPPLLGLAQRLHQQGAVVTTVLGYRSETDSFYQDRFAKAGEVCIASDDGTLGFHGHVGMLMSAQFTERHFQRAFACGPKGLLMAVKNRYQDQMPTYLSLESRMACGIGACYACVTPTTDHELKKICSDGPVFPAQEVIL